MSRNKIYRIAAVLLAVLLCFTACAREQSEDTPVKTVKIGEKEMDYLRFGNKDGEKFVILPGLALKSVMGSAEGIISAYSLLAEEYDVYLFDHVREEPEGYSIADMAKDTLAAFDKLGLNKVHLMGVSMGGMVAQTIAITDTDRVSSLILCSTAMDLTHGNETALAEWQRLAEERDTSALMASFGENVYSPSFYSQYKDLIIASGDGTTEQDYRNFLISLEAVRHFDVRDRITSITCPVFVIGAGEDCVLGSQAAYDLSSALNCRYYIYEGYGHGVYDEAPDYLARIKEFLESVKAQA